MKKQENISTEKTTYDSHLRKFVRVIHQEGEFPIANGKVGRRVMSENQYYRVDEYLAVLSFLEGQKKQLEENIVKAEGVLAELQVSADPLLKKYNLLLAKMTKLLAVDGLREKLQDDKLRQQTVLQVQNFKGQLGIVNGQLNGVVAVVESAKLADPEAFQ